MHLDVMVEDLEVADAAVRAIGARRLKEVEGFVVSDRSGAGESWPPLPVEAEECPPNLGGMTWSMPQYIVSYETPDSADSWQEDHEWTPPMIGHGVVDGRGRRWRIKDVWTVHEKHGHFEYGVYAFLEPAGDTDLMSELAPDYYGTPSR